ncbi:MULTISPECIES: hypothetical protein [Thioalkalivibrio]|uniref:Uncharacterized protein n=1 Tax=Thioalkalivibrio halophilus TaxID=252474 RepID=A0A1V2ZVS4_9GAMM|nr:MULTISPECIES: hypothetical protein [Thioalkalivibrio]OOC09155.1 hypothetical protein B1A74_12515 [Thioalkalivibrio halophilus]
MAPEKTKTPDTQEPGDGLTLHPEFVRIADGSRVVLLRESEFVQMLAALYQYEALRDYLGGDPLEDTQNE